ncbi:alpha-L-rhamnosidase [Occultella aeris]|uniref:alpha-L-rhamnosidase n=1 Tax=Occultella aeris TaxID=2761496 RepID=A0A7M4DF68_9MICO|nr:alpha-L-rhamnosidase [Occultella aeris]VZO35561.1 Bacterial alpha-L-rhamnosidase [Occultella aeris]
MSYPSLTLEHDLTAPALPTGSPRLSWTTPPGSPAQTGYAVEVTAVDGTVRRSEHDGDESVLVAWPFEPLASREQVEVRVRTRATDGWGDWSEPVIAEASLLHASDWQARMISPREGHAAGDPAPVLATEIDLPDDVVSARLYLTALGTATVWIGDRRVGEDYLAPGWNAYRHRLEHRVHDVTDHLLAAGPRTQVAAVVGNGWYRGELTWDLRLCYGDRIGVQAQLEIETAGGERIVYGTGPDWRAAATGVLADDLYGGQTTDLRRPGALETAAQAGGAVDVLDDVPTLEPALGPDVREIGTLSPLGNWRSPSGAQLVDFGQNLVGWLRIRVLRAADGQLLKVRHAEVIEHGELGTRPLRKARAEDVWTLPAVGPEEPLVLEPTLTFHGFRYAEIEGIALEDIELEAVVISSDLSRIGWFECSDPEINRLHENVVWGMRGNFVDVPTDCPQRDERLGWTGDLQVFAPTAATLCDVRGFLTSWLRDLAADQRADGTVPVVIPDVLVPDVDSQFAAGWSDAAVVVPWVLYERYGDLAVLERQYPSMTAWADAEYTAAGESRLWDTGFQYGDWLDPTAPPDDAAAAKADKGVVATAYLVRTLDLVARTARVLGKDDDAASHAERADAVRAAFRVAYVRADGHILSDCQTVYSLALAYDLLGSDEERSGAGRRLAELVEEADAHVSTGFLGTPVILDALCHAGRPDLAHRMLLQRGNPSWLYSVSMGATTIWERWDSLLEDGTINPSGMTSFNHYAYGAVADWLYRSVAGLAPTAPGYRTISIAPLVTGDLTRASARLLTPYGEAAVSWVLREERLAVGVTVPTGSTATIALPTDDDVPAQVGPGRHTFEVAWRSPV